MTLTTRSPSKMPTKAYLAMRRRLLQRSRLYLDFISTVSRLYLGVRDEHPDEHHHQLEDVEVRERRGLLEQVHHKQRARLV